MKFFTAKIREAFEKAAIEAANRAKDAGSLSVDEATQILEAEFSHDATRKALYSALRSGREDGVGPYIWRWIVDVFSTSESGGWLVYQEEQDGAEGLYRADYSINDAGEAAVSNSQRVKVAYEVLPVQVTESDRRPVRETSVAPAREKAIRPDGTMQICIIKAGDGSSGRYSREVLERDIPRIFPPGTQMFANHLSAEEEVNQPEGRIEYLAAETTTAPKWLDNGPVGAGMYCDTKPFSDWAPTLDDKALAIGVSINAWGVGTFGEDGVLDFTQLTEGRSIDFVTKAGAGGAIVPIKEARRPNHTPTQPTEENVTPEQAQQLRESAARATALEAEKSALEAEIVRLTVAQEARTVASSTLDAIEMPAEARTKLHEAALKNPPIKDGALDVETFKTQITEAAASEMEYLQKAAGLGTGEVRGNGAATREAANGEPVLAGVQAAREAAGL